LKLEETYRPNDENFQVKKKFEVAGGLDLLEEMQRNPNQ
jgi:hypothetical protein